MAAKIYVKNPALKTILPEWKGNIWLNGQFVDPREGVKTDFSKLLKWRFTRNDKREEKKNEKWQAVVVKNNDFLKTKKNCIVWLGHASFFMQLNGIKILIDPIFGKISGLVTRHSEMPCAPNDFSDIDYVLLSHAHRDHCDFSSLTQLAIKNNFTLLTSLNTGALVSGWIKGLNFQEAGWYQQYQLKEKKLRVTFLPTKHWSNRYPWDINQTLWGSFMIEADGLNIFFGGDSGYCDYPKEISELFPNIDIALIGVGAYHPAFMMKSVHTSSTDAVQVFHDLKAKTFIPMHYGTFDLADEPMGEPYRVLKNLESERKINGELRMLNVGEIMELN